MPCSEDMLPARCEAHLFVRSERDTLYVIRELARADLPTESFAVTAGDAEK